MREINCYIVDDEKFSIEHLSKFITKTNGLHLVGSDTNPMRALQKIKNGELDIDVCFVDIDMPELSGIAFAALNAKKPQIIFTTAHDAFAVKAFELHAVDYLLKPYSYERFLLSLDHLRQRLALDMAKDNLSQEVEILNGSLVLSGNGKGNFEMLKEEDIYYIESMGNYVKFCHKEGFLITSHTLKDLLAALYGKGFIQVHRAYIVNLNKVKSLKDWEIKFDNGSTVYMSENYKSAFLKAIQPKLLKNKRGR